MILPPLDFNLTTWFTATPEWELVDDAAATVPADDAGECGGDGTVDSASDAPATDDPAACDPPDPSDAPAGQHWVLTGYNYEAFCVLLPGDTPISWGHRDDGGDNADKSSDHRKHRHHPVPVVPPEPAAPKAHAADRAAAPDQDALR